NQRIAIGGDHDRIQHDLADTVMADRPGHDFHHFRRMQHAYLEHVGADVIQHRLDLRLEYLHGYRMDGRHAAGILRSQRGDCGHRVATERGCRLDVGLYAGTASAIGAGDGEETRVTHAE